MLEFDLLTAEQIEVRVSQISASSCSLLLYKDARIDMNMLDRHPEIGPERWQCKYYECKGNLYCSVGILVDYCNVNGSADGLQWIWKDDCGVESYTEKQKGEASDAFKRACFRWGIGRELYTAPQIKFWCKSREGVEHVQLTDTKRKDKYDRPIYTTYDSFSVEKIKYNDQRQITDISIKNDTLNKRVFVYTTTGKEDK